MDMEICSYTPEHDACAGTLTAIEFKLIAIATILVSSGLGVTIPLIAKRLRDSRLKDKILSVSKSFAAGVILATGFVHILPQAEKAFENPCVPKFPWKIFPFHSCIAMIAALATLVLEFVSLSYFEQHGAAIQVSNDFERHKNERITDSTASNKVLDVPAADEAPESPPAGPVLRKSLGDQDVRKVVVSQVLELGIIAHSIIIGITLGVSQSPCTIRPLMVALCFHQFFEGLALGSCISEAQFHRVKSNLMACLFAVTAPLGISFGTIIARGYNPTSPTSLIMEGIFDSASAGILIYLSLVDLIAAEFLGANMRQDRAGHIQSFLALFGGATAMAALAIWV